jgi:hypothetical protein
MATASSSTPTNKTLSTQPLPLKEKGNRYS